MNKKIGVAILGGTGYGAGELLRLFIHHPEICVSSVVSSSKSGTLISDVHPHLLGFYEGRLVGGIDYSHLEQFEHKIVIASLPHGASAKEISAIIPTLSAIGAKLIDLSGDFRLSNEAIHKKHYPDSPFLPDIRGQFVYGLPELNKKAIAKASYVANPGCLSSTCALVAAPLVAAGYEGFIAFDAKTGTSGAGKTPTEVTHHASRTSNFSAYKILSHRHEPEIQEVLSLVSTGKIDTAFVPHLLPTARGIFVTAFFCFPTEKEASMVEAGARSFYRDAPFVRFRLGSPELQNVLGTNFFDYNLVVRGKHVVAMGAVDNLVKGMAGVAIQNINILCGLPETTGLHIPSLGPC